MTEQLFTLGLIGYPLSHSRSPLLHNAALRALGLPGKYHLFPVRNAAGISYLCQQIRQERIQGLNVTIPHKRTILSFLDETKPVAEVVGAVNTLYLQDGKIVGDNTDAEGFLQDILKAFGRDFIHRQGRGLILGAGGAARAAAYALLQNGWNVTVAVRRSSQGNQFRSDFSSHGLVVDIIDFSKDHLVRNNPDLLINATPVGMTPNIADSPWPADLPYPNKAIIYDLIYNPPKTKFLARAKMEGKQTRNGSGMLIIQAEASFNRWTGLQSPPGVMQKAFYRFEHNLQRSEV